MHARHLSLIKLTVGLLLAGYLHNLSWAVAEEQAPSQLAVVRMDTVIRDHAPFIAIHKEIQAEGQELQEKLQLRQVELESVANKLKSTPPGSPNYEMLQLQLAKLQTEFRLRFEQDQQQFQRKQVLASLRQVKEVNRHIERIAKAKGYRMVIRKPEISLGENQPTQILAAAVNQQIAFDDCPDITAEVNAALAEEAKAAEKTSEKK